VAGLPPGTAQATLPWSWYSEPELLHREQERIFRHAWQYAGPDEHVASPGDYFTCRVGDVPVIVVHDRAGELHAFLNFCRHRGSILVNGRGNRETLQCRYHVWTYGLDDRALVESVQAGVRSGLLDEGRLMPESERLLAHFQGLVREALA
jgi:nitrite reductase/ring-hydroxylating ferredoxin subunit